MPTLSVGRQPSVSIPGLGRIRDLSKLSQKRITKAVREKLRESYSTDEVEVSCTAVFNGTSWTGSCKIDEVPYPYRVTR